MLNNIVTKDNIITIILIKDNIIETNVEINHDERVSMTFISFWGDVELVISPEWGV